MSKLMRSSWLWLLCGCAARPASPAAVPEVEQVVFTQLTEQVWLHTSYKDMPPWGRVPSNGLVVVHGDEAVLVDTAWDDAQTAQVLDWATSTLGAPITRAVATHAHEDKMGGMGMLRERQVLTWAPEASNALAPSRGLLAAERALVPDAQGMSAELPPLQVFFPGGAHTVDNVVVGVPDAGVLFGGCMIRPGGARDLGNTADADVGHWAEAVRAVAARFADATVVVPSHGPPAGRELLALTERLAEEAE